MQRKAAAIYFAFFIVMSASAYSVVAVAEPPGVELAESQTVTQSSGSQFTVGGVEHSVSQIELQEAEGDGHGGGGGAHLVGTVTYTQPDVEISETVQNGSEIEYNDGTYLVTTNSEEGTVVLTEQPDVTAILEADDTVANSTVESEGQTYVRVREDDRLVPLEEYLPEPDVQQFGTGDEVDYAPDDQGVPATVENVASGSVSLTWTVDEDREVDLEEGTNVTLADGNVYVVHFQDDSTVQLSQDHAGYAESQAMKDAFHERENGLWGVSLLSILAALLILGLAYMPVRG